MRSRPCARTLRCPRASMTIPAPFHVVIVDDHPLFRAGLAVALRREPGLEVLAEAGDRADDEPSLIADKPPSWRSNLGGGASTMIPHCFSRAILPSLPFSS